ncbi:MAG: NlpC/P60 family protein [Candidatus Methanomethylicaceae archaeon]
MNLEVPRVLLSSEVKVKLRSLVVGSKAEVCGFILKDGTVFQSRNDSENPERSFAISVDEFNRAKQWGEVIAVFHSHLGPQIEGVTDTDIKEQQLTGLPWGVLFYFNGYVAGPFWWGYEVPLAPLIGREFVPGVFDCYTLCRDFHKVVFNIELPNPPRSGLWWEKGIEVIEPELELNNELYDSIQYSDLEPGDVLIGRALSKVLNHFAVYLGDGTILHHLAGRLSSRTALGPWKRSLFKCYRAKGKPKMSSKEMLARILEFDRVIQSLGEC